MSFLERWWLFTWLRNSLSFMELEDYYMHWIQPWHKIYLYNFTFSLMYKKYFSIISPLAPRSFKPFLHYRFSDQLFLCILQASKLLAVWPTKAIDICSSCWGKRTNYEASQHVVFFHPPATSLPTCRRANCIVKHPQSMLFSKW